VQRIEPGRAVRLGRRGGVLSIVEGRAWLTRNGELGDHLLTPGQQVQLGAAERAVVEPWDRDTGVALRWQPHGQSLSAALLGEPLRALAFAAGGLARVLRGAAEGLAALARNAASSANRAQGCIAHCDSTASMGALK
jgi:hypothetical protein